MHSFETKNFKRILKKHTQGNKTKKIYQDDVICNFQFYWKINFELNLKNINELTKNNAVSLYVFLKKKNVEVEYASKKNIV